MRTYTKKYQLNQQIGSWTITKWNSSKGNYTLTCNCGNQSEGSASFVDSKIKSLNKNGYTACRKCSAIYRKQSKTKDEKLKRVFLKYKKSAKTRNLEFNLTLFQCLYLFKSRCYYCNDLPENVETTYQIKYQGIDRIDNNKGYIQNNVIPCCSFCNYAKHYHSQDKFLEKIDKIHKNVQRLAERRTQKSEEMVDTQSSTIEGDDIV